MAGGHDQQVGVRRRPATASSGGQGGASASRPSAGGSGATVPRSSPSARAGGRCARGRGRRPRARSRARPRSSRAAGRRERVAELLLQHRELDDAEPEAAVRPRRRRRPASRARRSPASASSVNPRSSSSARRRTSSGRVTAREELLGGPLDRLLVVVELEPHGIPRQSEHALGDDVLEDLGRPALDRVGAGAEEAVGPAVVVEDGAGPPRSSTASSVSAWLTSAHCHLPGEPWGWGPRCA